jgi:hypothetical protein
MDKPRARIGPVEFTEAVLSIRPYQWQREALCHIACGHPTAVTAANGTGKTSVVLVSSALWCLFNWPSARVIVTSASWGQLRKQFFDNIRLFRFHPFFRRWIVNEAEIRTPECGFIVGISVDEAGRAEGYHERPDSPVMILADECKSIDNGVFESLARCTKTFICYASSAGPAVGAYYAYVTVFKDYWSCIYARSDQCAHISKETIALDLAMWGEGSPQYRQKHLSEFTAEDEESFISMEAVRRCMDDPPGQQIGVTSTFIDWAGCGGDEVVVASCSGNSVRIIAAFRGTDETQIVRRVAAELRRAGLCQRVWGDAGGLGAAQCSQLSTELGIYVNRTHNGSAAHKSDEFANADAEKWFIFRRLAEKREIILPKDGELLKQLSSRRLQFDSRARIQLESKELMRSRGCRSPDRADAVINAVVLSMGGYGGGVTRRDLAGIRYGRASGGPRLFDGEPVTFG